MKNDVFNDKTREELLQETAELKKILSSLYNMLDIDVEIQDGNSISASWDRLKLQVKERTSALAEANRKLQVEITEHKLAEKALRESEEKFRKLAETAPALIFVIQNNRFSYINSTTELLTGYSKEDCWNINFWDFVHPDYRELTRTRGLGRLRGENIPNRYEFKIVARNGQEYWLDYCADIIEFEGQPAIIAVAYDITERKQYEEKYRFLSFHDKLTKLYNRAFFEEELKRLDTRRQLPLSLIIGDVNGLKLVNDALGHQEGDRLLKIVADILKSSCREEDIVSRWGGDEFAILLPETNEKDALKICDRIRYTCRNYKRFPIQISISLGHASKDNPDDLIQDVLKEAEDRMYRNKLLESQSARSSFINSLEKTLWTRSHETQEHCHRLREIAQIIAQTIDLDDSEISNLTLLATLHDIGKIAIPNSILDKPEKLTMEEWENIKKHPEIGYRIALSSPELAPIAEAILTHHERWDGNGYPLRLKGTDIPQISRIIAIADAYDVMINGRPYKKPISHQEVLSEIKRCAGTQFDPELAQVFIEIMMSYAFNLFPMQWN